MFQGNVRFMKSAGLSLALATLLLGACSSEEFLGDAKSNKDESSGEDVKRNSNDAQGAVDTSNQDGGNNSSDANNSNDTNANNSTDVCEQLKQKSTSCLLTDPKNAGSVCVTVMIPGGPDMKIDITQFKNGTYEVGVNGKRVYKFEFTAFLALGSYWTLTKPAGQVGTFTSLRNDFVATIKDADSADCEITAEVDTSNPRELVFPQTGSGCFDPDTKITLADGSQSAIKYVTLNDRVYNPLLKRSFGIVRKVVGPESDKSMYQLTLGSRTVSVSETHPFYTKNGLKQAKHLTRADLVLDVDKKWHRLDRIQKMPVNPQQVVYNLELAADHNDPMAHALVANGMIAGDLFLQNSLEKNTINWEPTLSVAAVVGK